MNAVATSAAARSGGQPTLDGVRDGLAVGLRMTGWLAVTLLVVLGVFAAFAMLVGGLSLDGTMAHLANLSSRYEAAAPERRQQFASVLGIAFVVVALATAGLRRASLVRCFHLGKDL